MTPVPVAEKRYASLNHDESRTALIDDSCRTNYDLIQDQFRLAAVAMERNYRSWLHH
jgi:hypothetical protein